MKNVIIYLIASFTLFACQDEYEVEKPGIPGKATLKVSVEYPGIQDCHTCRLLRK